MPDVFLPCLNKDDDDDDDDDEVSPTPPPPLLLAHGSAGVPFILFD